MRIWISTWGLVTAFLLGPFGCKASVDTELWNSNISAAESGISSAREAWRAAAREYLANPVPGVGACEVPTVGGGEDSVSLVEPSDLDNEGAGLREMFNLSVEVGTADRLVNGDHKMEPPPALQQAVERAAAPEAWGYDWFVLASEVVMPEMIDQGTFRPGFATGWLLLWSYADERFVCAGPYRATSSETVSRTGAGDSAAIRWNLTEQAFRIGREALAALPES